MQDRKKDIECRYFASSRRILLDHERAALPTRQESEIWSILWHNQCCSARPGAIARIGNNPPAISGYSDERDLVAVWIEGAKNVCGGGPGDIVFGGPTTEQDRNSCLSSLHRSAPMIAVVSSAAAD
jgi:hypothetical protein